jgi:hypothetical protein
MLIISMFYCDNIYQERIRYILALRVVIATVIENQE